MHIGLSSRRVVRCSLALALFTAAAHGGTWTKVTNNAPSAVNLMLLLSDGTVMCAKNNGSTIGNGWVRLTPNAAGSYIGGTWTTLASMADTRLYYSAQVLKDGRVFVAGGEYGTGTAKSEVYNPLTNTWTAAPVPTTLMDPSLNSPVTGSAQCFYDSNSEILPNGNVIVTPVCPKTSRQSLIYNPTTNTWAQGPNIFRGSYQDEASWVKLPDDTILTIDPFGTFSERYNPVSNTWINDGIVPVSLYDSIVFELGGAVLLPNGKAFFLGSTGHTAIYTPTGTTSPGTWIAGPDIPSGKGTPDAPCAMMVNGKVLCAVSPIPTAANNFPSPTTFYEFDYTSNSFTSVNAPVGASDNRATYTTAMLTLPDGNVLYSHMGTDVYVYQPGGTPLAAGKPVIQSITSNGDGSYHLTGTGLNGLSEGASYGDDLQMNSNYPLVRCLHSNGNTYYGRTFNWSSTSVMTGNKVLSTEFTFPSMPAGSFQLVVVGNGFASDPAAPGSVASNPGNKVGCPGGSVSFSVTGAGTPSLSYQWRRGATNLTNNGHYSGVNSPVLSISGLTAADAGSNYNCVVSNAVGSSASNNASLSYCAADFTCDLQVDDSDFVAFANAYNLFFCTDPGMAAGCPADLNSDGIVDDSDFVLFADAYSQFLCS
ncbi:MAG: kelch repeat-containing protein [Phycisphaerales bacterium]|nr:hypothetical protein [Planctomycetota bacterium]